MSESTCSIISRASPGTSKDTTAWLEITRKIAAKSKLKPSA